MITFNQNTSKPKHMAQNASRTSNETEHNKPNITKETTIETL